MSLRRGDIVLALYPFASGTGTKTRPLLVVQNDRDNQRLDNTIVAQITSEPTSFLIHVASAVGKQSGLLADSVISCSNLATIQKVHVHRTIGSLTPSVMAQVEDRLRVALGLP